jgi:5-methylcytosine-specific restriction endonuclease McrA
VFDFLLSPVQERTVRADAEIPFNRLIPTEVKVAVWKRDHGKCVSCGRRENLHYDHNLPYSKGGTSILAENVQLLCAPCNLKKSAKIEAWLPLIAGLAAWKV